MKEYNSCGDYVNAIKIKLEIVEVLLNQIFFLLLINNWAIYEGSMIDVKKLRRVSVRSKVHSTLLRNVLK